MITTVRSAIRDAYGAYLKKAANLKNPPQIGTQWPRDGFFLPNADTFMAELDRRSGGEALSAVLSALKTP